MLYPGRVRLYGVVYSTSPPILRKDFPEVAFFFKLAHRDADEKAITKINY